MSFLNNYSMKTLLLTYSVLFSVAFSSISYITGYFGGRVIIDEFLSQSEIIYERANTNKFSYATHYYNYLNSYFQINANPLITLNQLYLAYFRKILLNSSLNQNNFGGIQSYPSIIESKKHQNFSDSIFCYAFKNEFNSSDINQIDQVTFGDFIGSLGQIIYPQFDSNEAFLYGYIEEQPKPLYSYPCYALGSDILNFQPETRPWYILAQNISKFTKITKEYHYSISDPYLFKQDYKIGITLTLPLMDKFLQFSGAFCIDIFSNYIIQVTQKILNEYKEVYIMILTKDGILINQQNNTHIYFYDQNITGFNKNNWDQLKNKDNQYFKFMNQITNSQQSVIKFYLRKQQLYVSIIDNSQYQDYLTESKRDLQEKIQQTLNQTIILLFVAYFSLIFCVYLMISKLIKQPIDEITKCFKIARPKTLKEKYEDLLRWRFQIKRKYCISPAIKKLQKAVYYLNNFNFLRIKQKNSLCLLMEKFQFPKRESSARIEIMKLKLQNFNTQYDEYSVNRNQENSNIINKLKFLEINQFRLNSKQRLWNLFQTKNDLNQYLSNQIQLYAFKFVKSLLTSKSQNLSQ